MDLNLNHLEIFRAVAATGSISLGAQHLMISQPAVSKQIGLLERTLGIVLLERLARGVRLTPAGELVVGYANRIFELRDGARTAIEEFRGLRRGRLRIGASTSLSVYLLPELVVKFRRTFPDIQTELRVAPSIEVEKRLLAGELDLAITEVFSGDQELQSEAFHNDELVAIAPPSHGWARKNRISPRQLCAEPFIVRDTGSDTRSFVERALLEKGLDVKPVMSLGSTEAIKRAVAAGIGIAIVSRLSIDLELRAKTLAVLHVPGLSIRRPLFRLWRRPAKANPAIHQFSLLITDWSRTRGKRSRNGTVTARERLE